MKKSARFILAALSSLLLALPWYEQFSGLLILIAFVPLLFVEDYIYETRKKNKSIVIVGYSALTFAIWNILTTYWIYNAALIGLLAAIIINTLLMSTTFWVFHFTKRKFGTRIGQLALIVYWIGFEHFYLNAEISWPWLNLGNAFAKDINLIQWYEYTGTLGGTLWVLAINIMCFNILNRFIKLRDIKLLIPQIFIFILVLIIPIIISINIFNKYKEKGEKFNIAVIQPNIDPYTEKFGGLSHFEQLNIIIDLADSITDDSTDYVVAPETVLDNSIWINTLNNNYSILALKNFVNNRPGVNFVIGIDAYRRFMPNEELTPTARFIKKDNDQFYYDAYNSAIQIDTSDFIPIYHKSKLVVGVEKMPYPKLFRILEKVILDLGGTTGSRATQSYRGVFKHSVKDARIAPVICYESVYGEYVTDYIKNGANLIFIITNDGWWGNTIGYKHHLHYASLRAIETRRSIARSANTGVSAFINQKGEILNKTEWWKRTAIENSLQANNELTFYSRYGDYIGRIDDFIAILLFLYTIVQHLMSKSILKKKK